MPISFLTESTKDFHETSTVGSFTNFEDKNSFDHYFEDTHDRLMSKGCDVKVDLNKMLGTNSMKSYKDSLLNSLNLDASNPRERAMFEQVSQLWDNCVADFVSESTKVGTLRPYQAIDLPILVRQHLKVASKDIMQTEITKSPIVKKQMQRTWIVDTKTGKRWEYPTCFFQDSYEEIFKAGKGLPIKDTKVSLPLFNYDVISNLTDGNPNRDSITANLKITKVIDADGNEYPVDMRVNLQDGRWVNGEIKKLVPKEHDSDSDVYIEDLLTGSVNFTTNTVSLNACNDKIKQVVFSGYLSNELNERSVTFDYTRDEWEWKIEDGFRVDVPYSLEELEDAKALVNVDLYKKSYDNLAELLVQMEDSGIIKFLDDEFEKYDGIEMNPLEPNPFIRKQTFDCSNTMVNGVLQSEYIENMLKFLIDRFIIDITDSAKLEDVTFVCYGNPRYISLLGDKVNWVTKSGDVVGGVKANYSYGVMTSGGVKIQVVSANKIDAKKHPTLRFIPYPIDKEQFTFKHYKYTTHILTTANSGYRAADRPGGSMTNLMGVNRNITASIQGIQGDIGFDHADFILPA